MIVNKPVVRSLCLFLERRNSVDEYVNYYYDSINKLSDLEKTLTRSNYSVFTKRIVFPKAGSELMEKIIGKIDIVDNTLVSIGYLNIGSVDKEFVIDTVSRGFYTSLYGLWLDPVEYSRVASEIIHRVSSIEPFYASRLSVSIHREYVESPYFPDTVSSGVESIGLSFLLPKHITHYLKQGFSIGTYPKILREYVSELVDIVKKTVSVNRVFFDFSISPWMDHSVVDLVEEIGYKLLEPGFNYGLTILNSLINRLVSIGFETSGFNEVMLPYAEDYRLIKAGGNGFLKARDLLLYTMSCTPGPDMIVVPESTDKLLRFILDTYSVWLVKKKPVALRAVPVSSKPGEAVDLGKFGRVYVIDY